MPRYVAQQLWNSPALVADIHTRGALLTASLILPTAAVLGAAFPLALTTLGETARSAARRFGAVYEIGRAHV